MSARFSWLDVKLGVRMLFKHPALTVVGGLGMAVGIAISIGMSSFMLEMAYPDLPLDEGERIVALENRDNRINNENRLALHDFYTWRAELKSIEDVGAFRTLERNLIAVNETPELVKVAEMTAAGFRVARVPPLLGRYLQNEDESPNAAPVLVIGYDVWQTRFDGDEAVIGRQVKIGGVVHTIVGVMPQGFRWPENHQLWRPLRFNPLSIPRGQGPAIYIFGRLAPNVSMQQAQVELTSLGKRAAAEFPESNARLEPVVMPYVHSIVDIQGITLWEVSKMIMMTSLLLIVVALNVSVLVYARTATRQGEIAIRSALGASRWRVVGQLFAEALVLSLIAAGLGLLIAQFGIGIGQRIVDTELNNGRPFWTDFSMRGDVVVLSIVLAVLAAIIVGVLPGLQATGKRLQSDLRRLSGGTNARLGKTWTALIIIQVAIAVAALPVAVNTGWNALAEAATRPTFPADEFVTASLSPEGAVIVGPMASDSTYAPHAMRFGARLTELLQRLESDAAVAAVTYRGYLPGREAMVRVENRPAPEGTPAGHWVGASGIDVNFFRTFGVRLLAGRPFEPADFGNNATAVIVNQAFVQQVLGGENGVGERLRHVNDQERITGETTATVRWFEIVGVASDMYSNTADPEEVEPEVFYPIAPAQMGYADLALRLRPGTTLADVAPRLRQLTASVDPALRLGTVRSEADVDRQKQLAARLAGLGVSLVLISVFLLSAAGIYAMMSFTVTQRRREIGIRNALGARPRQVLREVFARAALQIVAGVVVGVILAAVLQRLTNGNMLQDRAFVILPALATTMAIVGLLAALGPVRRGLRVAPTEALRSE